MELNQAIGESATNLLLKEPHILYWQNADRVGKLNQEQAQLQRSQLLELCNQIDQVREIQHRC